jgi:hypothetical protein
LLATALFFTGVAIIVVLNPMLFFPTELSATDQTTTADRITLDLANNDLVDNGTSGLSHDKVVSFFGGPDGSLTDTVSTPDGISVNVTLTHTGAGPEPPTAFTSGEVSTYTNSDANVVMACGPAPDSINTIAVQPATLDNQQVLIRVTVWFS